MLLDIYNWLLSLSLSLALASEQHINILSVACRRPGRNSLSPCTDYKNIIGKSAATSSQNRERSLQFPAR